MMRRFSISAVSIARRLRPTPSCRTSLWSALSTACQPVSSIPSHPQSSPSHVALFRGSDEARVFLVFIHRQDCRREGLAASPSYVAKVVLNLDRAIPNLGIGLDSGVPAGLSLGVSRDWDRRASNSSCVHRTRTVGLGSYGVNSVSVQSVTDLIGVVSGRSDDQVWRIPFRRANFAEEPSVFRVINPSSTTIVE
jgi:hypothetical protein